MLTDSAYHGRFAQQIKALDWCHQVASRLPTPARWVAERTFAWLNYFRRLVIDYERSPASHAAWLWVANLTMSLQRATKL